MTALSFSLTLSEGLVHCVVTDFMDVSFDESLVLFVRLVLSLSSPEESVVNLATYGN